MVRFYMIKNIRWQPIYENGAIYEVEKCIRNDKSKKERKSMFCTYGKSFIVDVEKWQAKSAFDRQEMN